jgi:hypothetical protein
MHTGGDSRLHKIGALINDNINIIGFKVNCVFFTG